MFIIEHPAVKATAGVSSAGTALQVCLLQNKLAYKSPDEVF